MFKNNLKLNKKGCMSHFDESLKKNVIYKKANMEKWGRQRKDSI